MELNNLARWIVWSIVIAVMCVAPCAAQDRWVESKVGPNPAVGDNFGFSVDIDGDTVVVGSHLDDDDGSNSGSAYVYRRVDGVWDLEQKLTAGDADAGDVFGFAVAICGDYIVVGAPGDEAGAGAAYVFHRSGVTWSQYTKLFAQDAESLARLGESVAIDAADPPDVPGDAIWYTIVAGAPDMNYPASMGTDAGAIYLTQSAGVTPSFYFENGWFAPDWTRDDELGSTVSISGESLVASAPLADGGGGVGKVYVARRMSITATWGWETWLTASNGSGSDDFSKKSLDMKWHPALGGWAIFAGAGGYDFDTQYLNEGAAYLYRGGASMFTEEFLIATDPAPNALFGSGVAIDYPYAVVAAGGKDVGGYSDCGEIEVFVVDDTSATSVAVLQPSDPSALKRLGFRSIAISGGTIVAGSYFDEVVYIFDDYLFADGFEIGTTAKWSSAVSK